MTSGGQDSGGAAAGWDMSPKSEVIGNMLFSPVELSTAAWSWPDGQKVWATFSFHSGPCHVHGFYAHTHISFDLQMGI